MKAKTMILLVVAVACGLVASYMTSKLLADRNNTPPPENNVNVVFAKKRVQQYTFIKKPDDLFDVRPAPEGPMTAKAVKSLDELQGKKLNKTLGEDSIVKVDDLIKKKDQILQIEPPQ